MHHFRVSGIVLALLLIAAPACDTASSSSAPSAPKSEVTSTAKSNESSPPAGADNLRVDSFGTSVIKGRVLFDGQRPPPKMIRKQGDRACRPEASVVNPGTVIAEDGGLPHVFVYAKNGVRGKYSAPSEPARLEQHDCMFVPHVLGIRVGQSLEMRNGDETSHNIANVSKRNPRFNISQPNKGMIARQTFSQQEVMVKLTCNVHGWMEAYCGVLSHPFFTVTDENGNFEISRLPPGEYVIETWHELWGTLQQTIRVEDGKAEEIKFTYSREKKAS